MNTETAIKNGLWLAIIFGIIFGIAMAFWHVRLSSESAHPQRTFQVQGEGKAAAVPDIAEFSFGVVTEGGKNIGQLQKQNAEKANAIITFLKEQGIEEKDIKTQYYNISPRYQYYSCLPAEASAQAGPPVMRLPNGGEEVKPCPPSEIAGYSISQSISVKVRDFDKLGDILAGAVDRGATNISGPSFTIDDPEKLQDEAREKAIAKAKEKALAIAKAGGFRLGKLLSVQERGFWPVPSYALETAKAEGIGGGLSVEPGSQEVTVNVTLTYEIR